MTKGKLLARFEYIDSTDAYNEDSFYETETDDILFITKENGKEYGDSDTKITEQDFLDMLPTYLNNTECTYLDEEYFDFR